MQRQHSSHARSSNPVSGPRGATGRARSFEHGALRRRAPGRELEQHPFAQLDAVEAAHLRHRADGER